MSPAKELAPAHSAAARRSASGVGSSMSSDTVFSSSSLHKPRLGSEPKGDDWLGPYRMVHRALRGRYILVAFLGMVGAAFGAWMGWRSQKPLYRSEGVIRIAYVTPRVMEETDVNGPLAMYEAFMQSQRLLLSSRGFVSRALQHEDWKATGLGDSKSVVEDFAGNLKVEYLPRTEHLRISYLSDDPTVAAAATNSIIETYKGTYERKELSFQQSRTDTLDKHRKDLEKQIQGIEGRIAEVAGDVPPANLERLEEAAARKMMTFSESLAEIRLMLALAEKEEADPATPTVTTNLTPRQLAMVDPFMRNLLGEQDRLRERLEQLQMQFGESHKVVVQAKKALDAAEARIAEYMLDYRSLKPVTPGASSDGLRGGGTVPLLAGTSADELRKKEATISKHYEQAKEEVAALGLKRQEIQKLTGELQKLQTQLAKAVQRMDVLHLESNLSDRLEIISYGEVPLAPFMDRRGRMAAVAACAGFCLPVGLLLALTLASSRYRYSDETETDISQSIPLLGIVPKLPEYLTDPEQAAMAAQCMHQVRAMLQVSRPHDSRHIYMISSSTSGEGKTSMTVALGLSFAASGSRTLLIDCDMVGQRLSRGFKADSLAGVRESVLAGSIKGCVHRTNTGVHILSTGKADATDACALSSASIRRLLSEATDLFDVVLIDTGPVLGSVEPLLIAPEVDGVILCIARGQERPLVDKTLRQLRMAGARITGFIFNRAERRDFHRSAQGSSVRSTANPNLPARTVAPAPNDSSSFGPLVHSVASFLPSSGG